MKHYVLIFFLLVTSLRILVAAEPHNDIGGDPSPHSIWEDDSSLLNYHGMCTDLKEGETPLHRAAEKGDLILLRIALYYNKLAINQKDADGNTPLHKAVFHQHWDCANELLRNGALVNEKGNFGYTALHLVAIYGEAVGAALLLFYNANKHIKDDDQYEPREYVLSIHKDILSFFDGGLPTDVVQELKKRFL